MANPLPLADIIGIIAGGGAVAAGLTQFLKNRGDAHTRQSDELSKFRIEQSAKIEKLEGKLEKADERITAALERVSDLEQDLFTEKQRGKSFRFRVLNLIEFRRHDDPAWNELAREIRIELSSDGAGLNVPPPRQARILVVDDEKDTAEFIQTLLRTDGHESKLAHNGTDALQQVVSAQQLNRPYDLVLLDYRMPEMDGVQVAKRIRHFEGESHHPVKIMFLTGSVEEFPVNVIAEVNASGVLFKPIEAGILSQHVTAALGPHLQIV